MLKENAGEGERPIWVAKPVKSLLHGFNAAFYNPNTYSKPLAAIATYCRPSTENDNRVRGHRAACLEIP